MFGPCFFIHLRKKEIKQMCLEIISSNPSVYTLYPPDLAV